MGRFQILILDDSFHKVQCCHKTGLDTHTLPQTSLQPWATCVTALNKSSHTNLIKQAKLSPKQDKCQISVSPLWVFPIFLLVPCAGVGTAGTCQAGDVTMMAEPQHRAGRNSLLAVCRSQETIHSTLNDLYNFLGQAPGL